MSQVHLPSHCALQMQRNEVQYRAQTKELCVATEATELQCGFVSGQSWGRGKPLCNLTGQSVSWTDAKKPRKKVKCVQGTQSPSCLAAYLESWLKTLPSPRMEFSMLSHCSLFLGSSDPAALVSGLSCGSPGMALFSLPWVEQWKQNRNNKERLMPPTSWAFHLPP